MWDDDIIDVTSSKTQHLIYFNRNFCAEAIFAFFVRLLRKHTFNVRVGLKNKQLVSKIKMNFKNILSRAGLWINLSSQINLLTFQNYSSLPSNILHPSTTANFNRNVPNQNNMTRAYVVTLFNPHHQVTILKCRRRRPSRDALDSAIGQLILKVLNENKNSHCKLINYFFFFLCLFSKNTLSVNENYS